MKSFEVYGKIAGALGIRYSYINFFFLYSVCIFYHLIAVAAHRYEHRKRKEKLMSVEEHMESVCFLARNSFTMHIASGNTLHVCICLLEERTLI